MNTRTHFACWALSLTILATACDSAVDRVRVGNTSHPALPPEGSAVVCGTVIDLATGEPAEGVELSLCGKHARSDADGRFQIAGLSVGDQGELLARAGTGASMREARNPIQPLSRERREVVVQLPAGDSSR